MSTGPSLWAVGIAAVGVTLIWSGINDPKGGPVQVFEDLLSGKKPTPGEQKKSGFFSPGGEVGGSGVWSQGGGGGDVVSEAMKYLGDPYRWGGTGGTNPDGSKKGIDCSGLVLVAFRDARGIKLPHDATSQTMRGVKIPSLEEVQPGDLIAWGTPARYPHIAIAVDQQNCIGAWHYGAPCSIKPIRIKAVPGYGLPTAFRITETPKKAPTAPKPTGKGYPA